jgi:hypothetical protein
VELEYGRASFLAQKHEPNYRARLCSDERQVSGAEDIVLRHLGVIDRDGEQAAALLFDSRKRLGMTASFR